MSPMMGVTKKRIKTSQGTEGQKNGNPNRRGIDSGFDSLERMFYRYSKRGV
jgi:hypothetical protein